MRARDRHPTARDDRRRRALYAAAFVIALAGFYGVAADAMAAGTPNSVFHIDRSKNDNQVHYRIDLDQDCSPRGGEPVEPYWLRRSPGRETVEAIKWYQRRAYGVAEQHVTGATVTLTLRALPDRQIVIRTGPRESAARNADVSGEDAQATDDDAPPAGDARSRHTDDDADGSAPSPEPRCRADAYMTIGGHEARLSRAYVASEEGLLLPKVLYVDLFGETADGEPVEERIVPD